MPITPWLPGFLQVDLDLTGTPSPEVGRPYDETSHPKICLHTTEGATLAGAEHAFAAYPPHIGVEFGRRLRHQYLPLDRCSFSLRGNENDDEFVVQVEIVGFADRPPGPAECEWLGAAVIAPIVRAGVQCRLVGPPQGFHGGGEGMVLASTESPIRFHSEAAFRAFSGVCGHQHVPPPDVHWDPGAIDIGHILMSAGNALAAHPPSHPTPPPAASPVQEDIMRIVDCPGKPALLVFGDGTTEALSGPERDAFRSAGYPAGQVTEPERVALAGVLDRHNV